MIEKRLEKVCIDCINANEHLKISTDFKVSVEFGTCDCCGKRYILVPFRRFFSENTKIVPKQVSEEKSETPISCAKDISDLNERINLIIKKNNEVREDIEILRKAKVECTELKSIQENIKSLQESMQSNDKKESIPNKKNTKVIEDETAYE